MSLSFDKNKKPGLRTFVKPTRTKQAFREECNINSIVERYLSTGVMGNPLNQDMRKPFYGDFSSLPGLQEALNITIKANEMWERLPAKVRFRFRNDPVKLDEFVRDEKNREEAIKMGLIPLPEKKEEPVTLEGVKKAIKDRKPVKEASADQAQ